MPHLIEKAVPKQGRLFRCNPYRYGFNGKEEDDEVKGVEGGQQDYGMRIYDPRLGRFLSVDPLTKEYPFLTPYQFASNTPVMAIDVDGMESDKQPNKTESSSTESSPFDFMIKTFGGKNVSDATVGGLSAGKDAVIGAYDFVRRDAWKMETYENALQLAFTVGSYFQNDPNGFRQGADQTFGFTTQAIHTTLSEKFDVSKWNAKEWGYNVTAVGITIFGPKLIKNVNSIAASNYLKYAYGGRYFSAFESGTAKFSLRMGNENFIYHQNAGYAAHGRFSSPTLFANSAEAFESLALDYAGSSNKAQVLFSSRSFGLYISGKTSPMGSTLGGGSQLLKTGLSLTTKPLPIKEFSLRSNYSYRSNDILGVGNK